MGRALAEPLPHRDELAERLTLVLDGSALFTDRRGLAATTTSPGRKASPPPAHGPPNTATSWPHSTPPTKARRSEPG